MNLSEFCFGIQNNDKIMNNGMVHYLVLVIYINGFMTSFLSINIFICSWYFNGELKGH